MKKTLTPAVAFALVAASTAALIGGVAFFLHFETRDIPAPSGEALDLRSELRTRQETSPSVDVLEGETAETSARPNFPSEASEPAARNTRDSIADDLENRELSSAQRRQSAFLLAKEDPDRAAAILQEMLETDDSPAVKAALAEALGDSTAPETVALIDSLIAHEDPAVAAGAVRGIARRETEDAAGLLANLLLDVETGDSVRTEAAIALGEMHHPSAFDHLMTASYEAVDLDHFEPVFHTVLQALGQHELEKTSGFFTRLLEHPDIGSDTKTAALEALADVPDDATDFLTEYAKHADADLREAALWALGSYEPDASMGSALVELLHDESEPAVRSRLYDLLADTSPDPELLWDRVMQETDPDTFLSGARMLAAQTDSNDPALLQRFDSETVPALKKLAGQSSDMNTRLRAITALGKAETPGAADALQELSSDREDPRIKKAVEIARTR